MNTVSVPWKNQSTIQWNEICADIVNHFGLPGDRYTTEVSVDEMLFFFKNEKDALMCTLLISHDI